MHVGLLTLIHYVVNRAIEYDVSTTHEFYLVMDRTVSLSAVMSRASDKTLWSSNTRLYLITVKSSSAAVSLFNSWFDFDMADCSTKYI